MQNDDEVFEVIPTPPATPTRRGREALERRAGVAIVAVDPKRIWREVKSQSDENDRRDRATPDLCAAVLMAIEETRYKTAEAIAAALGGDRLAAHLLAELTPHPSYTEMRNFLIGELDAHPVVACRAAMARAAMHAREDSFIRDVRDLWHGPYALRGERGWL